jgi:hypothetical protein
MPDESCRIAKLEAFRDSFIDEFREHCRREETESKERREILEEVRDKQMKMTGFLSGAAFVITALASIVGVVINKLLGSS